MKEILEVYTSKFYETGYHLVEGLETDKPRTHRGILEVRKRIRNGETLYTGLFFYEGYGNVHEMFSSYCEDSDEWALKFLQQDLDADIEDISDTIGCADGCDWKVTYTSPDGQTKTCCYHEGVKYDEDEVFIVEM